ncbi:MAG TPA: SCO family protein [Pirellulales bacterium]|nr:SCO family protein [Pirellulales bacterium]
MNTWAVRGWILFAAVLALLYGGWIWARSLRQSDGPVIIHHMPQSEVADREVTDFELTDQTGQPFGTAELRGKVWMASFFFASCPGACRQLNQVLEGVVAETPADVMLVSLTCDPETDTPEVLTRYGAIFHADPARWRFLTGKLAELTRVSVKVFQVSLEKQSHSFRVFVVDRSGHIRGNFMMLQNGAIDRPQVEKMLALVRKLDDEPPPAAVSTAGESPSAAEPTSAGETSSAAVSSRPADASPAIPAAEGSQPAGGSP